MEEPFIPCELIFPRYVPKDWVVELRMVQRGSKTGQKRIYEVWLNQERLLGHVLAMKPYPRYESRRGKNALLWTDWRWAPVGGVFNTLTSGVKPARGDAVWALVDDVLCKPAKIGGWAPRPETGTRD